MDEMHDMVDDFMGMIWFEVVAVLSCCWCFVLCCDEIVGLICVNLLLVACVYCVWVCVCVCVCVCVWLCVCVCVCV